MLLIGLVRIQIMNRIRPLYRRQIRFQSEQPDSNTFKMELFFQYLLTKVLKKRIN